MANKPTVLIVDDEKGVRESVRMVLRDSFEAVVVESGEQALEWLKNSQASVVFLDILMPGMDGLEVLERIKGNDANTPVVMLTATKTVKTAVTAMKLGAFDYLTKPFDVDELRIIAERAAEHADLRREVEGLRGEVGRKYHIDNIIGNSDGMQAVFETVARVAPLKTTVLITGESGTGKELIAKAIHHQSPRASKAMVTLNCAAIPENLLESELFGHEKGSFTDAVQTKIGQFEHADASTIFLDEIGEMSAALQAKLLRALEEGEVMRVGGDRPVKLDVRVISATNRDLQAEIAAGRFRDDLYYRLNVVALEIPPLRHRGEDLSHLIGHFLKRKAGELGMDERGIGAEALQKMLEYQWPGNVRELENLIERMLVLTPGQGDIGVEQLSPELLGRDASGVHSRDSVLSGNKSLSDAVDDFERDIIGEALSFCQQNQTRAADQLGTTRRILKYRMDKLGISLVEQ